MTNDNPDDTDNEPPDADSAEDSRGEPRSDRASPGHAEDDSGSRSTGDGVDVEPPGEQGDPQGLPESKAASWLSTLRGSIDVSIETWLQSLDDSLNQERQREGERSTRPRRRTVHSRPGSHQQQPASFEPVGTAEYPVATRTTSDELIVIADVAGVDEDAVVAGFDGEELVIVLEGTELTRVEVPWEQRTTSTLLRNGILTVSITRNAHD